MAKQTQSQNKLENWRIPLEKLWKWKTSINENQQKPTDNSTQLSLQKKEETMDNSTSMSKNIDGNFKVSPTHTNREKPDIQAFINDKNDEEELLNRPINPLSDEENLVIQMIGNMKWTSG